MLKIRLRKTGRKHINTFDIIICNSKQPRDTNRILDKVGYYQPSLERYLKINLNKLGEWINKGAQPTIRVKKLIIIAQSNDKYLI